jgi:DNA polymerase III delta prime subunit
MQTLKMPHEMPPPTVALRPEIAILLKFPGQREVVETSLSALQQYDGTIIATPPGTGKTYTVLAIAKEMAGPGKRQLIITRNNDIITQRKGFQKVGKKIFDMDVKRLPDDMNKIGEGVYAITYATLRDHPELKNTNWDLVIADEAGEARRWWESSQGKALHNLSDSVVKMVYASATPFHTALEIGYMKKLNLWDDVGFDEWARQFGVRKTKEGTYSGGNSPKKLIKMRQQLIERGQLAHQNISYDGYRAEFAHVPLTEEHIRGVQNIRTAFNEMENYFHQRGKPQLAAAVRGNGVNFMKSYLERVRLPQVIEVAKRLNREGWQVAIFSEHNQERMELYDFAKEADRAMNGRISELLPKLPGVFDTLEDEFGDNIANFSGSFSAKRQGQKDDFLDAKKDYLYATYGAGGVGTSLHDDVGNRPRAAIYMGPPWSGVMLDQALGRLWRFGTKSNVHSIFMSSNAKPEVNMILTKIAPRLEALRAAVAGVDGNDPLVTSMRSLDRTRDELANFEMGQQQKVDISDFDFLQNDVPIASYKDIGIVSSENAKNKGMRYAGQVDETPGVITLFQEDGGLNVPPRFQSPDEHGVENYVASVSKDLADGNPVPGAPEGIQDVNQAHRTMMADGMGPYIQQEANSQVDGDKKAAARLTTQAEIASILGAQRAGQVHLDPESQEWSMTYPLGEARAKLQRSEEITRVKFAISGRQQIEAQAGMAGKPEIGRQLHNKILDYHATNYGWQGEHLSNWYKFKKDIGGISAKEFKLAVMTKEGKIPSPSEKISKIVAKLTENFNGFRQEAEDNDIENKRYIDGKPAFVTFSDIPENDSYWTRRYNMAEKITVTDPTTGEKDTFTLAQLVGGTLGDQRKQRIIAAISKEHGISQAEVEDWLQARNSLTPVRGSIERSRQANMPFYRTDEASYLEYIADLGEVLARKKVFGQNREQWDGLVAQVPNAKARETINNIVGSLLSPAPWANTRFQQLYRKATAATIVMKMTLSTAKLPGHLAHITLVQGQIRNVLGAVLKGAISPREARNRALFAGALSRETISHAVTEEGLDKGFANKMLHYTGFHAMYNVDRVIGFLAAQGWMEKTALPKLIKKSKDSEYIRRELRNTYLLTDEQIDMAIKEKRFSKADLDRGGVALVNKTLFVNDPTELPHWLRPNSKDAGEQNKDVAIRAAMVLKGFTFRTLALLKERLIDEARTGNLRAWMPFLIAYPAIGAMMKFGSAAARGTVALANPLDKDKNPFEKYADEWEDMFTDPTAAKFARSYFNDLGMAAGLDLFAHVFNTIVFPPEIAKTRRQQLGFMKEDLLKYLFGPEYGTVWNAGDMTTKMLQSDGDREKFAQSILDFVREEVPVSQNLLPKKMKDIYEFEPFPSYE